MRRIADGDPFRGQGEVARPAPARDTRDRARALLEEAAQALRPGNPRGAECLLPLEGRGLPREAPPAPWHIKLPMSYPLILSPERLCQRARL